MVSTRAGSPMMIVLSVSMADVSWVCGSGINKEIPPLKYSLQMYCNTCVKCSFLATSLPSIVFYLILSLHDEIIKNALLIIIA